MPVNAVAPSAALSPDHRLPLPSLALTDVATGLARTAARWQAHLPEHPHERTGLRLISTADYDAWLLRWPLESSVGPHDHGDSSGAFTVVAGELTEVRWHRRLRRTRLLVCGQVVTIDAGVVHDVVAAGPDVALSVHVYSPPLTTMGSYDDAGRYVDRHAVDRGDGAFSAARDLHPARGRLTAS